MKRSACLFLLFTCSLAYVSIFDYPIIVVAGRWDTDSGMTAVRSTSCFGVFDCSRTLCYYYLDIGTEYVFVVPKVINKTDCHALTPVGPWPMLESSFIASYDRNISPIGASMVSCNDTASCAFHICNNWKTYKQTAYILVDPSNGLPNADCSP
jgi:hypothetical protein